MNSINVQDSLQALEELNKECIELLGKRNSPARVGIRRAIKNPKQFPTLLRAALNLRKVNALAGTSANPTNNDLQTDSCINSGSIVVYSCITGEYDRPREPFLKQGNVDYVLYSDNAALTNNKESAWQLRPTSELPHDAKSNPNRYCKMHPAELFPNYDFAIYMDGNMQVVSELDTMAHAAQASPIGIAMHTHPERDCAYREGQACILLLRGSSEGINSQLQGYRQVGFPENFGLFEATVVCYNLNNEKTRIITKEWWDEFISCNAGRDQISFPYVLWKLGYSSLDVGVLGDNVRNNPKLRHRPHDA